MLPQSKVVRNIQPVNSHSIHECVICRKAIRCYFDSWLKKFSPRQSAVLLPSHFKSTKLARHADKFSFACYIFFPF